MEEDMKYGSQQIPAFGHWDCYEGLPITQYFESAWQAGLVSSRFWEEDEDLFKVMPAIEKPAYHHPRPRHRKVKKKDEEQPMKMGKVRELSSQRAPRRHRPPKAVDEDLYKIPPELVYRRPKKKRLLRNLLTGCLGLNCIA